MIVVCKHSNRLCNRLFTYLPILSYALEAEERVVFLFQYRGYDSCFPHLREFGVRSLMPSRRLSGGWRAATLYALVCALDNVVHLVLKPGEPLPLRKPLGVLFGPRWRKIRYDGAYVAKHRDRLRWLFAPPQDVEDALAEAMPAPASVAYVGIHIRRGDYRGFRGGAYHYADETYRRVMSAIERIIRDCGGKVVRFLLCSDEPIDIDSFAGFDTLTLRGGALHDLYGLARCRLIAGPPSTFSLWASFYGGAPHYAVRHADAEPKSLADFRVCDGLTG